MLDAIAEKPKRTLPLEAIDPKNIDELSKRLESGAKVFCFCFHGKGSSPDIARSLNSQGISAVYLDGGLDTIINEIDREGATWTPTTPDFVKKPAEEKFAALLDSLIDKISDFPYVIDTSHSERGMAKIFVERIKEAMKKKEGLEKRKHVFATHDNWGEKLIPLFNSEKAASSSDVVKYSDERIRK